MWNSTISRDNTSDPVLGGRKFVFVLRKCSETLDQSCLRVGWTRGSGRVGAGRVTILPDFGGSGRVSTSDFLVFYLLFLGT